MIHASLTVHFPILVLSILSNYEVVSDKWFVVESNYPKADKYCKANRQVKLQETVSINHHSSIQMKMT